jgi:hypothetical protein
MTAYAFGTGRFEGDNGCKATLHDVSLDFGQKLESLAGQSKVAVALGDGELEMSGVAKSVRIVEGVPPTSGQIYFETTTSNFGVLKKITIKLNNCLITGNTFEAKPDQDGNVFTLSMED